MLIDQSNESGPIVDMEDMCMVRQQWPTILLSRMSRRQIELETMRHECKAKFRNKPAGLCGECSKYIQHDMTWHVATYHLAL